MNDHHFMPDATVAPDHRDERPCTCGLPRANRVHDVVELDPDVAAVGARIIGEDRKSVV